MSVTLPQVNDENLSHGLLHWYDRHRRTLPWRALPGERSDPYRVWLSEIMLQQTTVATVGRYFVAFTRRWPQVEDLAAADLDDVLREWAGLGYYARARNLHACAKMVANELGGRFPETEEGLQSLPGVGPYTAAAIAAIAFNRPAAAVDGNVERVMSRLRAIEEPLPASKPSIRAATLDLVPDDRPGDFAQALMDLGATICTPKSPNCLICPWLDACTARKLGIEAELPRKAPKKDRPVRRARIYWAEDTAGRVLMRRRAEKGLLGGMLEFPSSPWVEASASDDAHAPFDSGWHNGAGRVEHTFTHFHLLLDVHLTDEVFEAGPDTQHDWRWVAHRDLAGEALPTVMKKVAVAVLGTDALRKTRQS
jgi:A/G-specific adenine glycosylase